MATNNESELLQQNLRSTMERSEMSASELSRKSGVSMASLSRILSGQVNPSLSNMVKIAEALDTSIDTLAGHSSLSSVQGGAQEDEKTFGRRKSDFSRETDILVHYVLDHTDLKPEEAMRLLSDAANGSWVESWTDQFVMPDSVRKPYAVSSKKLGTKKLGITMCFPHDYLEEGSAASLISVLGSAVTGTHARVTDVRIPPVLLRTFNGPGFGVQGIRDSLNKYGRPLLSATLRPMSGMSPRMYARTAFETLRGGADFTCDPTLLHSIPNNHWRDRFAYLGEAVLSAQEDTNEQKMHAANVTAPTVEDMIERAEYAKTCGLRSVMVDSAAMGWGGVESLARWCRKNGMFLCAMGGRSLQSMVMSEQSIAKLLRLVGADVVSIGSPLRGGIANRRHVKGVIKSITESDLQAFEEGGQVFDQPTCGLASSMPACGGGHNPWHFPRLLDAFGDDVIIQCGGSVMGHPWGGPAGATANRVAIEACVQARGEGHNLTIDGRNILQRAARYSSELKAALEHWQEGAFLFGVIAGQNKGPLDAQVIQPAAAHLHAVTDDETNQPEEE